MHAAADFQSDTTFFAAPAASAAVLAGRGVSHALVLQGAVPRRIPVGPAPLTIGRVAPCDIVLNDSQVSRAHSRVELAGEQFVVTDLRSTNGTFVDGQRIAGSQPLQHGAVLRIGNCSLVYERRTQREMEDAAALDHDLREASTYVQSLLPEPVRSGPVRTEWLFLPCAQLGGSGFGTGLVTPTAFSLFMLGVVGHGTSAAMQSVSVMSLLRQRTLPGADFADPGSVLDGLTATAGAMRGASYAAWYGVFDTESRQLAYASAGHFPGLLTTPTGTPTGALIGAPTDALDTLCPAIGVMPGHRFETRRAAVPPGAALYLLNDGVADLIGRQGDHDPVEFLGQLVRGAAQPGVPEPLRLHRAVRDACGTQALDEDFVALVATFP